MSPCLMPSSIANFASGAGASEAAVAAISATNIAITRAAVGAQQREQAAQLAPAPAGLAQAAHDVDAERGGGHSPATSGSSALRVRKTWSGRPFSTISP